MKRYDWSRRDRCANSEARAKVNVATMEFLATQRMNRTLAIFVSTYSDVY